MMAIILIEDEIQGMSRRSDREFVAFKDSEGNEGVLNDCLDRREQAFTKLSTKVDVVEGRGSDGVREGVKGGGV